MIGDGLPYDDGYENHHAVQDTRAALREALADGDGVGAVSLGIRSSVPEAVVAEVWGEVTFPSVAAIAGPLTDDPAVTRGLIALVEAYSTPGQGQ